MKQPDPTTIGQRIKAERERLGLTQEQVAGQLQVTRGSYCQWEERCNARLDGLFLLAKIYDLRRIVPELFDA